MSKVLDDLSFYLLTTKELQTMVGRLVSIIREDMPDDPFCLRQLEVVDGCLADMEQSSKRTLFNKFTQTLSEADDARDAAFKSFLGFVEGMAAVSTVPALSDPAKAILRIIERHGRDIPRLAYAKQSGAYNNLINELQEKENQKCITAFQGNELFSNCAITQKEFDNVYLNKVDEEAQKDYPLLKEIKDKLQYRLEGLLNYLDLLIYDRQDELSGLKGRLNDAINDTMDPVRARKTKAQNAEVEEPVAG